MEKEKNTEVTRWGIANFPVKLKNNFVGCAKKNNQNVAELLTKVIIKYLLSEGELK